VPRPDRLGPGDFFGVPMPFGRNCEVYGEGEPAEYIYRVVSGAVRTSKILADGRRQIGGFYLSGDIFGLDAGEVHHFSAEAICDSSIAIIKRSTLAALASRETSVARQLWILTARELERVQDHTVLLIRSAQERVACFLLEMAERLHAADAVELPMSRHDIADYLGLTIETVSRTLAQLQSNATIALPRSRRIVLRNRKALSRLNA
jgi:CRP/FNR family nitrogen fixation transcriptional regulator